MGKKKKFIDKKNSATFQLLARDSSDPAFSHSDRVFVRVDNNPLSADSIFDDAPDDQDGINEDVVSLPEEVRKEILELGFPDDGYNYLTHLREIKNAGGGSAFYHNPKFKLQHIPRDIKAYDASRLKISEADREPEENSIYTVASKTASIRVQKAIDPEVAALLDDSDLSRFGSDIEDLEEDFVVQANLQEDEDDEEKAHTCNDLVNNKEASKSEDQEDTAADVIRRCKEYAEGYEVEDEDKDVVLLQESSNESEVWDCETIVSTYSNLDNHPGKIEAPEITRRKKLAETVSAALSSSSQIISLKGKEKLPIDFLPGGRKPAAENIKGLSTARTEQHKRKQHGLESKEEKKERKAAVKKERREARRVKKEMKGLYKCEAHWAQRAAAVSGVMSSLETFFYALKHLGKLAITSTSFSLVCVYHSTMVKLVRFYDISGHHYKVLPLEFYTRKFYTWLLWVFCPCKNVLSFNVMVIRKVKQKLF
ncbi:Low temperature viability protein [Sesbania bispinosa]|nr:Low temperature viability protein [Sesbania bispinosa]